MDEVDSTWDQINSTPRMVKLDRPPPPPLTGQRQLNHPSNKNGKAGTVKKRDRRSGLGEFNAAEFYNAFKKLGTQGPVNSCIRFRIV